MREYKQKPAAAGTLISAEDSNELLRQDARRKAARAQGPAALQEQLRNSILAQVGGELEATKWGAQADVADVGYGEEVIRPIRVKHPRRKVGKLEAWFLGLKRHTYVTFPDGTRARHKSYPLLQWPLHRGLRGFIFNEGGRGVTLTVNPDCGLPLRLSVAGWVLTCSAPYDRKSNSYGKTKWSFKRFR